MPTPNRKIEIEVDANKANSDLSFRFMELWHQAKRQGVTLAIIAFPTREAGTTMLKDIKIVGDHPADLACGLDIADAYLTGLRWRNR